MKKSAQSKRASAEFSLDVVVENSLGLHARPATLLVQTASRFAAEITIGRDGHVSDGKSIIGVLMLGAGTGTRLNLTARGEDAQQALDAVEALFRSRFGEE
ncbi:MAG: HPr family phosphocarrier protein [Lentisphaerae bacterium]|nr:HPr family phosphocarrier protein [Lentisphaerota bacterium]